jgi:hypothetical protein
MTIAESQATVFGNVKPEMGMGAVRPLPRLT